MATQTARSVTRLIPGSPQKLNVVAQMIRRRPVFLALADLRFSRRRVAGVVYKALQSAIANAENNHAMNVDRLVVAEAYVGKSLTLKRFRARARGRVGRIMKPFSRLTIVVKEEE
ncbi:MAG: 50S ribosomal protein L22 [Pseudomonadota bacterium]